MGFYLDQNGVYYEGDQAAPQHQAVPQRPDARHGWNGSAWVLLPPEVPKQVTMRQARIVLKRAGLLDAVNTAVAQADEETRVAWEFSSEVHRDNPLVSTLAAALNLTDAQLDDLFTLAATL